MARIEFKFSPPGGASSPETKGDDMKPREEKTEPGKDAEPRYSRAELGKMLGSAIKSGDGEVIFEAFKKLSTCEPTD